MLFIMHHMLSLLILLPLLGLGVVVCLSRRAKAETRIVAITISLIELFLAIVLAASFVGSGEFEFQEVYEWIPQLGVSYRVGVDGVGLLMVLLTAILVPVAIASSWREIDKRVKGFHALVLLCETGMIGTFVSLDAFLFYVFWEIVLIPMYFIIGVWGSGNKIRSSIKFVIFTVIGSLVMLVGILCCAHDAGGTFDLIGWYGRDFAPTAQFWLFGAFALAFAIKLPVVPLHTWLPDAHTDAPTAGSVLLAGVLLKMGAYGFYRFAIPLFPNAAIIFSPYMIALGVAAIVYGGLIAMVQTDMKRLIAYSSIAHMGFVVLGLFALDINAARGAAVQMFVHGIVVGGLFMMVGMLYARTKTRMIADLGGVARTTPLLATFFIVFALCSAGVPGLATFVGEFLVLLGGFQTKTVYVLVALPGVIIAAVYMLWLVQRVFFGAMRGANEAVVRDMGVREHLIAVPLIAIVVAVGVWPRPWLNSIDQTTNNFLKLAKRNIPIAKTEETLGEIQNPNIEIQSESKIQNSNLEETNPYSTIDSSGSQATGHGSQDVDSVSTGTYEEEVRPPPPPPQLPPPPPSIERPAEMPPESAGPKEMKKVEPPPLPAGIEEGF